MAKKFMFVCLGVLALAVAYHLGASSAVSNPVPGEKAIAVSWPVVLTDYGNFYEPSWETGGMTWVYIGTFNPPATATQPSTWGSIKAQFRE